MATLTLMSGGAWVVTCPTHGYVGSAIYMAKGRAEGLAGDHNGWCLP